MDYYKFNIFSNMIYILPILCILYEKFLGNRNKKFESYYSNAECLILIISFILINCISSIYHNCEKIQERKRDENPYVREYNRNEYICYDTFNLLSLAFLDHLIAYSLICIILVIITPIYGEYKILMIYLIFIINLLLLSLNPEEFKKKYNFESGYIIYTIIGFIGFIFYGDFFYNINIYSYTSLFLCFMATLFFIGAIVCFILPNKLYDIKDKDPETKNNKLLFHSLWHLFSGIAGSLLLLIRIKNIDILEKTIRKT